MNPAFARDGSLLSVIDTGAGCPVVFQHGLGGDAAQVAENFPDDAGVRRVTVECRAQGASTAGDLRPFSIAMFADDVLAACDRLGLSRFVMGGISMGAAIAVRIASRRPERVAGLVLARPAWLFAEAPETMRMFIEVAEALRALPPDAARARFAASDTAERLLTEAPDNLASALKFFDRPDPAVTADLLSDIARDGPGVSETAAAALRVPTLVIGHAIDVVHPLAYAERWAAAIPDARLARIAPKASDKPRHVAQFRDAVAQFLASLESA